jgi:hypothetical protein
MVPDVRRERDVTPGGNPVELARRIRGDGDGPRRGVSHKQVVEAAETGAQVIPAEFAGGGAGPEGA